MKGSSYLTDSESLVFELVKVPLATILLYVSKSSSQTITNFSFELKYKKKLIFLRWYVYSKQKKNTWTLEKITYSYFYINIFDRSIYLFIIFQCFRQYEARIYRVFQFRRIVWVTFLTKMWKFLTMIHHLGYYLNTDYSGLSPTFRLALTSHLRDCFKKLRFYFYWLN